MIAKSSSCHCFKKETQTYQTNTITIKDASFCNHLQNPIQHFFRLVASQYLLKQRGMTFQTRPGLRYNSVPHLQKLDTAVALTQTSASTSSIVCHFRVATSSQSALVDRKRICEVWLSLNIAKTARVMPEHFAAGTVSTCHT